MIWVADEHGNLKFANKTYLKYFEVAPEDVAGQRWKDLVHPDDYGSYSQQFLAASIARRSFRSEARGRGRDGEWRWIEFWAVPRTTESGDAAGMVGCSVDITERKQAEKRIRELGAIVEASDDAGKGAERFMVTPRKKSFPNPISILLPADRQDELPQILSRLARGEAINHYETVRRRKDGQEIHVSLTISPIRNLAGQGVGASTVA